MIKVTYTVPSTHPTGNQPLTPVAAAATVIGTTTSPYGDDGAALLTFLRGKFAASQIVANDAIDATFDGQNWTVSKNGVSMGALAR